MEYETQLNELLEKIKENSKVKEHMDILLNAFYDNLEDQEGECKGIGLDGKRPFGNSDIARDVAEILDLEEFNENDELIDEDYFWWLYTHLFAWIKYNYLNSKANA